MAVVGGSCTRMQESIPGIESRARFITKVAVAYLAYAALCAVFVWYALYHNPGGGWVVGGVALIGLLGILFWFRSMRAYIQRHRAQTRAFYSKLGWEVAQGRTNLADAETAPSRARTEPVTVSIGMYTLRQTTGLMLILLYQTPRNALVLVIMSLFISLGWLFADWPPTIGSLMLALAVAIAFNGLLVAMVSVVARRVFKKLWQGKSEAAVTISSRGLELGRGAKSSAIIPWTSIDRVRETGSWILFMRDGRRIMALPISQVPQQSLDRLRAIWKTAKGQLADLDATERF